MRIPLTKYGLPQAAVYPAILAAAMVVYFIIFQQFVRPHCEYPAVGLVSLWIPELLFLIVLMWVFSFFRDPHRIISEDPSLLLSPADGTIAAVETLASYRVLKDRYYGLKSF
jgi:hypothetical protein